MSAIVIAGDTSGTVTLQAPAVSGTTTITLPAASGSMIIGNTSTNNVTFANSIVYGGVTVANTVTGTGSMVLSASPALTGTATAANLTLTGTLTSGTNTVLASVLSNIVEPTTVSNTAAANTITFDIMTQSVVYYTANATANWTMNFRANSNTTLNNALSTGQTVTVAFLATQGGTAYYNSLIQIDGANTTAKYQGGTAWSAGNASGIDGYTYSITKTANATYNVLASQTQFK